MSKTLSSGIYQHRCQRLLLINTNHIFKHILLVFLNTTVFIITTLFDITKHTFPSYTPCFPPTHYSSSAFLSEEIIVDNQYQPTHILLGSSFISCHIYRLLFHLLFSRKYSRSVMAFLASISTLLVTTLTIGVYAGIEHRCSCSSMVTVYIYLCWASERGSS